MKMKKVADLVSRACIDIVKISRIDITTYFAGIGRNGREPSAGGRMAGPISVEYVNPFLKATVETYRTMLGTQITPGKPVLRQGRGISYDISGVIGISGEIKGSVAISYQTGPCLKSVSAFLGEPIEEMNDDAMDAVGELVNIVAGYAKKFLDAQVSISLPTVIAGQGLIIKEPPDVFSFAVPFSCELGEFDVAVGLKRE
jgi:chemotaxis protein CheX